MKKVLILGHKGYIGSYLVSNLNKNPYVPDLDPISFEIKTIDDKVDYNNFNLPDCDVIINCIGYTGHPNIDAAENNKEKCYDLNVTLPSKLVEYTSSKGIHLVHLSSGCIFDQDNSKFKISMVPHFTIGKIPIDAQPNPKSFYAKTKMYAEFALKTYQKVSLVRIRMPIDENPHPRNLINKLLNYNKIVDAQNSMTSLNFLKNCIREIILTDAFGTFHCTDIIASPATIMSWYKKIVDPNFKFEKITPEELNKLTTSPRSNCVLCVDATQRKLKIPIKYNSQEIYFKILKKYKENLNKS